VEQLEKALGEFLDVDPRPLSEQQGGMHGKAKTPQSN
jgi:hypothetical protein